MRTFKTREHLLYFLPPHAKQDFSFHFHAGCASSLPQDSVHLEMTPEPLARLEGSGTSLALPHPDSSVTVTQEASDAISESLWLSLPSGLALSSRQKLGYQHLPKVTDRSSVPQSSFSPDRPRGTVAASGVGDLHLHIQKNKTM